MGAGATFKTTAQEAACAPASDFADGAYLPPAFDGGACYHGRLHPPLISLDFADSARLPGRHIIIG